MNVVNTDRYTQHEPPSDDAVDCGSCGRTGDHPIELRAGLYACSRDCATELEAQICTKCWGHMPTEGHVVSDCYSLADQIADAAWEGAA